MGKVIAGCRKGKGGIFRSHTRTRKGAAKMRPIDYAEKHGYIRGVVKDIIHDPGRGAPLAKVQFMNMYKYGKDNELIVATEGMYTGMFIYCGKKASLSVGNILPLSSVPEGTIVCNIEAAQGDRGKFAKCSGDYAVVVSHDEEKGTSRIRLPSGGKKTVSSSVRAQIGEFFALLCFALLCFLFSFLESNASVEPELTFNAIPPQIKTRYRCCRWRR